MFIRLRTKRDAYPLYLVMELTSSLFSTMIFTVSMIYQVTIVGLNPLQLVLVGTVLEASAFLFEIPTGVVADVYSRRLSIIIGWFLIGAGFILEGLVPRFEVILLAQVLWGLGYTFTSGATEAWIADEVGEAKAGRAFLRGAQLGQIGALIGIVLSVAVGSVRVNVPIILGGVLFIVMGGVLLGCMPETGFKPTPREERSNWQSMVHTFRRGLRLVRGKPVLISILSIGLIYGLYSEGWDRLWTAHLLNDITLPTLGNLPPVVWFGLIGAVSMLLSIGTTEFARRRVNTNDHAIAARALFVLNTLMIAGIATFALTGHFVLALIAYWLTSSVRRTTFPIYTAWVNQHLDSSVRATVISMSSQIDALGQIIGGPIVGAIGTALGIPAALIASALILSPVLILLVHTARQDQTQVPVAETVFME